LHSAESVQWKIVHYSNFSTSKRRVVGKVANVRYSTGLGPWRSRFIFCLNMLFSCKNYNSALYLLNNRHFLTIENANCIFPNLYPCRSPLPIYTLRTDDSVCKYYRIYGKIISYFEDFFGSGRIALDGKPFGAPLGIAQYK
jgi:hypothetical protein